MRKPLAALLVVAMLLSGCGTSSAGNGDFTQKPVQDNKQFMFTPIEDAVFTMMYEPRANSGSKQAFGLSMPDGIDSDWAQDTEFDANFTIFDAKTKKTQATVRVQTAPADLAAYYKTENPTEIQEQMIAKFFTTDDYHKGLRGNIVDDFGYQLAIDWSGIALKGWRAFYMEFVDEGSKNHALRFYMCNDKLDKDFYAIEIRADLPMGDEALIEKYRSIIFSMREFEA